MLGQYVHMPVKRTTIELDEDLASEALAVTGATLRATVERGLRLVIAESAADQARRIEALERYRSRALDGIDVDVLLSGNAWP